MAGTQDVMFPGVWLDFRWAVRPEAWTLRSDGSIEVHAAPRTDLFIDPLDGSRTLNACRLVAPTAGDYLLSARVAVDFRSTFDAGVLVLWRNRSAWAKLCFERSPGGEPMVVSVVTRRLSDDCNSFAVPDRHVWLRVSGRGSAFAFHASTDGRAWQFIRHFSLGPGPEPLVGFLAQSPTGSGCPVVFSDIRLSAARLDDLRRGD